MAVTPTGLPKARQAERQCAHTETPTIHTKESQSTRKHNTVTVPGFPASVGRFMGTVRYHSTQMQVASSYHGAWKCLCPAFRSQLTHREWTYYLLSD